MEKIPYASTVGSLMYAHVCTRPDIAYIVEMLGKYLSNPGIYPWKAAKMVNVVFTENKGLRAHVQEIKSVRDHQLF